jgi:ribose 5-phosphate isomerase B
MEAFSMKRRTFLQAGLGAVAMAASISPAEALEEHKMNIVLAADPFAVDLKDAVKEHLEKKGHTVLDVGAVKDKDVPYYDAAPAAAKLLQSGKAERAILFCGTGAGMCIVANKFKGVNAVCVESVFSAKMARAINDSNAITLGAMIVAPWMAKAMVDAWLETKHTEGLDSFAGFLKDACVKVNALDTGQ